jgi:AcrR family transcriptional regulator
MGRHVGEVPEACATSIADTVDEAGAAGMPVTARRILAAAQRIMTSSGLAGLTFQAIERESGVSGALVSYYFGDKAGLVAALADALFEESGSDSGAVARRSSAGEGRLWALVDWQRRMAANLDENRILYELLPLALRVTMLRDRLGKLYRTYRAFDAECLAGGVVGLDPQTAEHLAAITIAVVEGLGIQKALDPDHFALEAAFDVWVRLLTAFIAVTSEGAEQPQTPPPATSTPAAASQ